MQNVDVAIVGGGMVGLALACGLQGSGLRVAVLEQKAPQPVAQDAGPTANITLYGDSFGRKGVEELVKRIEKLAADRGGKLNLRFGN